MAFMPLQKLTGNDQRFGRWCTARAVASNPRGDTDIRLLNKPAAVSAAGFFSAWNLRGFTNSTGTARRA